MRQLLTDHARASNAEKRGGHLRRVEMSTGIPEGQAIDDVELPALDQALTKLRNLNARQAQIVEMRFLAGLSLEDTAETLEVSVRTVSLDWRMAKTWLQRELEGAVG